MIGVDETVSRTASVQGREAVRKAGERHFRALRRVVVAALMQQAQGCLLIRVNQPSRGVAYALGFHCQVRGTAFRHSYSSVLGAL